MTHLDYASYAARLVERYVKDELTEVGLIAGIVDVMRFAAAAKERELDATAATRRMQVGVLEAALTDIRIHVEASGSQSDPARILRVCNVVRDDAARTPEEGAS